MTRYNNTQFFKMPKIYDFFHFETGYVKGDLKWITVARNFSYLTLWYFCMLGLASQVTFTKVCSNGNM